MFNSLFSDHKIELWHFGISFYSGAIKSVLTLYVLYLCILSYVVLQYFALSIERTWPDLHFTTDYILYQWFSNFLHQVPPQKIFGFPSTTIMTNIKMQYKWLPTAPGVCSRCVCVCVCVCVCSLLCVCVHFGWVKCRAQIPSMSRHFHFQ